MIGLIMLFSVIYFLNRGYDKLVADSIASPGNTMNNEKLNYIKDIKINDGVSKLETRKIFDTNNVPLKASALDIESISKDLINQTGGELGRIIYQNKDYVYLAHSVGPCCARLYTLVDKKTKQYYSIDLDINDEYESEKMGILPYIFEASTDYGRGYKITNLDSQNVYTLTLPNDKTIIKSYQDALNLGDFSYQYDIKYSTSTKVLNIGIYKYDDIDGKHKVKSENYMKNQNVNDWNRKYDNFKISTTTIDLNNYK